MAVGRRDLPIINQSVARQIRSSAFRTKTALGPQTAQAVTEGALADESREAIAQENIQQQAEAEKSRLSENKRQFDIESQLQKDRAVAQERQFEQQAIERRKVRKRAETSEVEDFFTAALSS